MTYFIVSALIAIQINVAVTGNSRLASNFTIFHAILLSIPGKLKWISVGKRTIWGVNSGDEIFAAENIKFDAAGNIMFSWKHVDGSFKQIRVYDI